MSSKIVLYRGRRGCGKTLSMVFTGAKYKRDGWRVLANFQTSYAEDITNEELLELNKESELFNCVIMIDEIQILFDSRRSMKKENISFSNFIQQVRKRNIIILGATQYIGTVDLRFRQHCDILAYPNFIKNLDVCELTMVDVTAIEDTIISDGNMSLPSVKIVFNAKPIYEMYNTEEMIK